MTVPFGARGRGLDRSVNMIVCFEIRARTVELRFPSCTIGLHDWSRQTSVSAMKGDILPQRISHVLHSGSIMRVDGKLRLEFDKETTETPRLAEHDHTHHHFTRNDSVLLWYGKDVFTFRPSTSGLVKHG